MITIDPNVVRSVAEITALSVSALVLGNGMIQNGINVVNLLVAGWKLAHAAPERDSQSLWSRYNDIAPPITLLVPAYNEEATIVESVRSLLALQYPNHEVIVVNDGSKDGTVQRLIEAFELEPAKRAYQRTVPCEDIRSLWVSRQHPNLLVADKENGGKADALNAAINLSRMPLVCAIDADSVLEPDSLIRATKPFMDNAEPVVAVGGTIRVANGCKFRGGRVVEVRLPTSLIALFQSIEYLRAFLLARLAWSSLGVLTLISGAFGVFERRTVLAVGGYSLGTVGEDLELIIKIHRYMRDNGQDYAVQFVAEPVCWTEVPTSLGVLASQRSRWQRGALETFFKHKDMMWRARYGRIGIFGLGQMLVVDVLGPPIEVLGYLLVPLMWWLGVLSAEHFMAFFAVIFVFGVFLSVGALILEEAELHRVPRARDLFVLLLVAIVENFGYRQLNSVFRVYGTWQFLRGSTGWGEMKRAGFRSE